MEFENLDIAARKIAEHYYNIYKAKISKVVYLKQVYIIINTNPPEIQAYAEAVWKMYVEDE